MLQHVCPARNLVQARYALLNERSPSISSFRSHRYCFSSGVQMRGRGGVEMDVGEGNEEEGEGEQIKEGEEEPRQQLQQGMVDRGEGLQDRHVGGRQQHAEQEKLSPLQRKIDNTHTQGS